MEEQTLDDIPECWISRGLSEKSREVAREKLNETNDRQSECLTQLRIQLERYAASHPDLTFSRRDDRFLTCFLRTARYDVDKAMSLLKKYIKFRSKNSHMLMGVSPETLKPALKNGVTMALPQRDPRGRRVLVFRMANSDKRKVSQLDMQRLSLYVLDALVQDEEAQVNGFVMVVDYGGMTMTHMSELDDSTVIEQNVAIFGEAHPACFEEYHIINQPWYYGLAKSAMKPYMSDDMKKRIYRHGPDMEGLVNFLPISILPEEIGGDGPPYDWEGFEEFLRRVPVDRPSVSQNDIIRKDRHE